MASASWSLQQGIYNALVNNAPLTALLGGPRIHDDAPQDAAFPYVTLSQTSLRDWSTGTEAGLEHLITLHVWSRYAGKKEAHEIIEAVRAALHEAALTVSGYRLVTLRHQFSEARPEPDGETIHGVLRFRAVTEPAP